jgi:hypothetical protein
LLSNKAFGNKCYLVDEIEVRYDHLALNVPGMDPSIRWCRQALATAAIFP